MTKKSAPKKLGRPSLGAAPRVMISFRIDADLLARLKSQADRRGVGYQTRMHDLLTAAVADGGR